DAHGFLFKGIEGDRSLTDLGAAGGQTTVANGISDSNVITGFTTAADGRHQAFRWNNGTLTALGFLNGGTFTEGRAINNDGKVARFGDTIGVTGNRAFLYGGAFTNLGTLPGGDRSESFGLNDAGDVVGYSTISGGAERAFLYRAAAMVNLGVLAGDASSRAL